MTGTYPGGKAGQGVYQRLINEIPPHDVYAAVCAGYDAIGRIKLPARLSVFCDLDPVPLARLDREIGSRTDVVLLQCCGVSWMRHEFRLDRFVSATDPDRAAESRDAAWRAKRRDAEGAELAGVAARSCGLVPAPNSSARSGSVVAGSSVAVPGGGAVGYFVFVDPPYPHETRTKRKIYAHEWDTALHERLLETLRQLPVPAMVTCYPCELYDEGLSDWRRIEYDAPTRGGLRRECAWMNYPRPEQLHDSRFVGGDKRERERIRRRARNFAAALKRVDGRERQAIMDAIAAEQRT